MKTKLLIVALLITVFLHSKAQLIENKLHIQFSYGFVKTMGGKNTNEDGFAMPSLFANFSKGNEISLRTTYKLRPAWSIGIEYNQIEFDGWKYGGSEDLYHNSLSTVTSYGISVKVHTKFKQEGTYNKLQLYAILSPCISNIELTLEEPTFSIQPQDQMPAGKIERNSQSWGLNSDLGLIYSVTQKLSLYCEGGLFVSRLESQLHNDKYLKAYHLNAGICVQLMKSKIFY